MYHKPCGQNDTINNVSSQDEIFGKTACCWKNKTLQLNSSHLTLLLKENLYTCHIHVHTIPFLAPEAITYMRNTWMGTCNTS